jgi:CRISPR type III-A-associated RAMP protein Csm5
VHIGSGNFLQNNSEFVNDNGFLYVIAPEKLLNAIGEDRLDYWVAAIEGGSSVSELVPKGTSPKEYAKRCICLCTDRILNGQTTLKECMHDGRGVAYIPGSSIKGAIRTAILADLAYGEKELGAKIKFGNEKFACSDVEKELFGKSPNSSLFRFLQVGDAYFTEGCEIAMNEVNLNITEGVSLLDEKKQQMVEAVGKGFTAEFSIKLLNDYNAFAFTKAEARDSVIREDYKKIALRRLLDNMASMEALFATINKNTGQLIKKEINKWQLEAEKHNDDATALKYVDAMKEMLCIVNGCKSNECVLRVGQASGWRFTTGAWAEKLDEFDDVITMARPKNKEKYRNYVFPKSRRIAGGKEYTLLGFVKLTLQ